MSNNNALAIKAIDASTFQIEVPAESIAARNALIADARAIQVKDQSTLTLATEAVSHLRRLSKDVEALRVELKAPLLQAGKRLDELAYKYSDPIKAQIAASESDMGTFVAIERRKEEDARRAKEEEERQERDRILGIERQQAEAARAERVAQEIAACEAARFAEGAKNKAAMEKAEAAAREARLARQQAQIDAEEARLDVEERARQITVSAKPELKTTGLSVRTFYEIEIDDPVALWKAFPHLVELVPRIGLIRGLVEASKGQADLPGLRVTITQRPVTRAS